MSALVYTPHIHNYRKLAQQHYNLTEEQLAGVDIHHNPPLCEGGRNIPEHLFIYHPITHKAVHDRQARNWARKSSGNKHGRRGKPPTKTQPSDLDLQVLTLRQQGLSRKEVGERLNLKDHQVKRCVMECKRLGYNVEMKPGPKKGCPQRGGNPKGINQFTGGLQNPRSVL